MVRGCQRKVIFLKNTESEIFSEAYFIVAAGSRGVSEADMVREANRIIENNLAHGGSAARVGGLRHTMGAIIRAIPAFLLGGGLATALCLAFLR